MVNNNFRETLLKSLLLIGGISSFINLPVLYSISTLFAGMVISFSIGYFILYILLKKNIISFSITSKIALFIVFIQLLNIPFHAGIDTLFLPWILIAPILAFGLIKNKFAFIYSLMLLLFFLIFFFAEILHESYTFLQVTNFFTLYLSIFLTSFYISKNVEEKELMFAQQNSQLENMNYTLTNSVKVATTSLELQNKKLQESVNKFQDLLDSTMEMIVLIDKNNLIIEINQSGICMLGFSYKTEVIGTHISNYIQNGDLDKLKKSLKYDNKTSYELQLMTKDKSSLTTLLHVRNSIQNQDKIKIATLMDLSEIQEKEKLLLQQTRLAQMGEMISMIAHQWRQPLGAITNTISSIQIKQELGIFDLENQNEREKYIAFINEKHQDINDYINVLSSTIDDFRNFFKPDKDKEIVPITNPITKALQIVALSMESKDINIIKEFSNNDAILMYQNELMQVILNIFKNSEDTFIEKNIINRKIIIKTYKKKNQLTISLEDNAGGIAEDILLHIFEPYFSTKKEKDGTGLGLYMSKTMIEKHNNGKLNAKNTADGVCFTITLPYK